MLPIAVIEYWSAIGIPIPIWTFAICPFNWKSDFSNIYSGFFFIIKFQKSLDSRFFVQIFFEFRANCQKISVQTPEFHGLWNFNFFYFCRIFFGIHAQDKPCNIRFVKSHYKRRARISNFVIFTNHCRIMNMSKRNIIKFFRKNSSMNRPKFSNNIKHFSPIVARNFFFYVFKPAFKISRIKMPSRNKRNISSGPNFFRFLINFFIKISISLVAKSSIFRILQGMWCCNLFFPGCTEPLLYNAG